MINSNNHKFINYGKQKVTESDIESVVSVLKSPYLTQGPCVPAFEESISQEVKAKYVIAVNSATSALHLACHSLGITKDDWVWTSPTTFVASANCAKYCGAKVDFVDIDPETGLISIKALERKLIHARKKGKLPKAVIPVHLAGTSCDMKTIKELSIRFNFFIIEDASHAIGGKYLNAPVGNCKYSDISVFSFHPVKIITTGEGGACTTNNLSLAKKIRELRSHGIVKDRNQLINKDAPLWAYEQQSLGFNYRMTDIQAALGINQIKRISSIIKERNILLDKYKMLLNDLPLKILKIPSGTISSVHLAIIRFKHFDPTLHSNIFNGMRKNNIGVQLHYLPVHLQPYYRNVGYKEGDFPEAEKYALNSMSLPLYPGLTYEQQLIVVETLKKLMVT